MKILATTTLFSAVSALVLIMASDSIAADDSTLWSALAEGGKVVMIRHTQSEDAPPEVSMHLSAERDCTREQNLSEEGRQHARALGVLFQEQGIEVDAVMSSEFCRARETAELAFGEYDAWLPLNLLEALPADESEWLMEDVRETIGDFDGEGVLVLVSHRSNINTISFQQTEPGNIVVMEPNALGGFSVLGLITQQ
ncbi:histidine phosphatase family protein [Thiocapsa imhoffii]|uniref:Histidine phosphatase family protein n=1 Tax=Thiocapsa imhoffii TaxID=382777 RepID=A0A9X0WIG2_9GAMM|nr:histidine phosphatase family protein [Thiocapsa imhoffii]MBK1645173.1 histidine phosphatase family protein [Thiocapsa imhoffii]